MIHLEIWKIWVKLEWTVVAKLNSGDSEITGKSMTVPVVGWKLDEKAKQDGMKL